MLYALHKISEIDEKRFGFLTSKRIIIMILLFAFNENMYSHLKIHLVLIKRVYAYQYLNLEKHDNVSG